MKKKPGKALEDLVAAIETILCSNGDFEVIRNAKKQYKRTPFAEFDIIVKGRAGSNPVNALIECRDRKGRAPNEWIHALANKKRFHGFTSVSAVTTGGFAKGCEAVAARDNIDLRTVSGITPSNVLVGFEGITARNFMHGLGLRGATIHFVHNTPQPIQEIAANILSDPVHREGPHFFSPFLNKALGIRECFWGTRFVRRSSADASLGAIWSYSTELMHLPGPGKPSLPSTIGAGESRPDLVSIRRRNQSGGNPADCGPLLRFSDYRRDHITIH